MSQCGYDVAPLAEPLPRVAAVLRAARARGLRVVHTRQYSTSAEKPAVSEYSDKRLGAIGVDLGSAGGLGRPLRKGEPGFEIHPSVAPAPGELVIDKVACSAFIGTDLQAKLKERRVDKLIICGITLDVRRAKRNARARPARACAPSRLTSAGRAPRAGRPCRFACTRRSGTRTISGTRPSCCRTASRASRRRTCRRSGRRC